MGQEENSRDTDLQKKHHVLLITGLSGAGRGTCAKILEDFGWYVADNIPARLIPQLITMSKENISDSSSLQHIAVVVDVRTSHFTPDLDTIREEWTHLGIESRILYVNASDSMLIRRFEHVKRPHPLQSQDTLIQGIQRERELLETLHQRADYVVDTSNLSVHDLRKKLAELFLNTTSEKLNVTIQSFGFKNGIPLDTDMLLDVRFVPNPHWIPHLRPHNGMHPEVSQYVLEQENVETFIQTHVDLLGLTLAGYRNDGKSYFNLAIGCTGGKHRSVAISQEFFSRLSLLDDYTFHIRHRDTNLE